MPQRRISHDSFPSRDARDRRVHDDEPEACAADGVYEFLFVGGPLDLINATGSPASPLAIK